MMHHYPFNPLCKNLTLLDYTDRLLDNSVDLQDVLIIAIQHLLPTTYSLFHRLFERGLKPQHLWVLGKCYSTNPMVAAQLRMEGVYIDEASMLFSSHEAYDLEFDGMIISFLRKVMNQVDLSKYRRILILDDGGHLLQAIHDLGWDFEGLVAVEQTSSGYHRTVHLPVSFPVVNLARCFAKLLHEPEIVLKTALRTLDLYRGRSLQWGSEILLIGHGFVGGMVRKQLSTTHRVICYDIDPKKSDISPETFPKALGSIPFIIGCTGNTSIPKELHSQLHPRAILASLSSSDREFDAVHLRRQIDPVDNCHEDLCIKGRVLLNSGFPINFHDDYNEVDHGDFQFTRSLILTALIQACQISGRKCGYISLDESIQKKICAAFFKNKSAYPIKNEGENLF